MSLLGKLFGVAKGFATGGPGGAVSALLPKQKRSILTSLPDSTIYSEERFGPGGAFGSKRTMKTYTDGGGAGPYGGMQTPNLPALYAGAACPIGYRLNKSTYITRGGGTSRWGAAGSLIVHPKGSTCVKRRRRNVGNARALRRAISRVKGFVKLARKAHSLVGGHRRPTKMIGKGGVEVIRAG
jgi:hypothetical protein